MMGTWQPLYLLGKLGTNYYGGNKYVGAVAVYLNVAELRLHQVHMLVIQLKLWLH